MRIPVTTEEQPDGCRMALRRLWASGMSSWQVMKSIAPPAKPVKSQSNGRDAAEECSQESAQAHGQTGQRCGEQGSGLLLPPLSMATAMANPSGKLWMQY